MSNLPELMERLEYAAKLANQKVWFSSGVYCGDENQDDPYIYTKFAPEAVGGKEGCVSVLFIADWGTDMDAAHIAASQPRAILELITALRASTLREGELRELVKGYRESDKDHSRYCKENVYYPGLALQDDRCSLCERADKAMASTVAPVPEVKK